MFMKRFKNGNIPDKNREVLSGETVFLQIARRVSQDGTSCFTG